MSSRDWDIFGEMARLRRELGDFVASLQAGDAADGQWTPPVDILEREGSLVLLVDLPGVRKEDIELHIDGDSLSIKGRRERPEATRWVRMERQAGEFQRAFRLGAAISPETVQATWREGVLEIVLHRSPPPKPVQVRVEVE